MGTLTIETDGGELYVVYNGKRIAKRGHLGTHGAGTWISLEPGFTVRDAKGGKELIVERDGAVLQ